MMNKIKESSIKTQQMLLIGLCQDYNNYNKVRRFIDLHDFTEDEYKKSFLSIKNLYDNNGFTKIDNYTIEAYCLDKNISSEDRTRLDILQKLATKGICNDFDGTYSLFRRNAGFVRFMSEAEAAGGFEKLFLGYYDETNSAEEMKTKIDDLSKGCFKQYQRSLKEDDISRGMLNFFENEMFAETGSNVPMKYTYLLNQYIQGVPRGLTIIGGFSGTGKTTITFPLWMMSVMEHMNTSETKEEKVLIIANEQESNVFRRLCIQYVISFVMKNKRVPRDCMNFANKHRITEEQMNILREAATLWDERYRDRIHFCFIPRFSVDDMENLITEYQRKGYKNILVDTMKPDSDEEGWGQMSELAKLLDALAKEHGLRIVATAQLASHMKWRKYLDVSCLARAKAIKDVAETMVLFRKIKKEELPSIECSYWDNTKQWISGIKLDPEKEYIVMFIDKNRAGKDDIQIVYELNLDYLYIKEVGQTKSIKDDTSAR